MNLGGHREASHRTAGLISGSVGIYGLWWRASSYADTNCDHATESSGIRREYACVHGYTNRYADAANTIGSNANGDGHAHGNHHRDTSARVARAAA